jgi:UDP-N-acetylmuramoyl-tripeptide--D-alanyl-D-alanine ligase
VAPAIVALPTGASDAGAAANAQIVPFAVRHQGVVTRLCLTWHGAVEEFDLRRVTTGMAGNAALALAAALHLGVSADELRVRLPRWRPAALRGEVRRQGDRTMYLDCYNANPASMADAVEAFIAIAPATAPRLFVIGCMEELGADAAELHRATGARWPLRANDRLVVFGSQAEAFAAGARTVAPAADVLVNPEREEAARLVRAFRGAIFLKGSRRYALETLLDDGAGNGGPHGAHARKEVAA